MDGKAMTYEEASSVLDGFEYDDEAATRHEAEEIAIMDGDIELAFALAVVWRQDSQAPGFPSPGRAMVATVEEAIGEDVWT